MLVPHNREPVFRFRLSYNLARYLVVVFFILLLASAGGVALLLANEAERKEVQTIDNIWHTRLQLVENRRARIMATLSSFEEKGADMVEFIWGEKYDPPRYKKDTWLSGEFIHHLALAREALYFFDTREDALQNMPSGMPISTAFVTSTYGSRISPFGVITQFHTGVDFANSIGTPILATADGEVVTATLEGGGYGLHVRLLHKHGLVTLYGHMSALNVEKGQMVKRGDVIGLLGQTGFATGPHVHYEVRLRNPNPFNALEVTLNPWPFIKEQL